MEHEASLRSALSDDGDIELRFHGGEAIPVHSLKLKLASSVLKDTITAVLDDLIASSAAKRRRTAEGSSSVTDQQEMPSLRVSHSSSQSRHSSVMHIGMGPSMHISMIRHQRPCGMCQDRLMAPMRTGWRC